MDLAIESGNFRCALLEHTITHTGKEAYSWGLCYERFIHAEVMTHRAWARNASSARAIPWRSKKQGAIGMVDWVRRDPAMPIHLGTNKPGMQSGPSVEDTIACQEAILSLLDGNIRYCDGLMDQFDLHKEIINRYIEAWSWINVVATMGREGLMNFFNLRITKFAHPNIQRLAVNMARQARASKPRVVQPGEWHMPFVHPIERVTLSIAEQLVWSVARSAWTSYQTVDGKVATFEQAQKRHDDCVSLKHMTPCEHQLQARADTGRNGGNVAGYDQYRHMIPNESAKDFDFTILDRDYADCDYIVA